MLFYAITPLCFRLLKKTKHRELLTAMGVAAGVILYRLVIECDIWLYLDVLYRVPVYFLGLLMGFYVWEGRKLGAKDILFWCFWSLCGLAYLVAFYRVDIAVLCLPLCPLFLFTTVPMCLVICLLFEHLPLGGLRRILRLVGENSLEIYLLNVSFFSETALLQRYLNVGPGHYGYYLIALLLNIAFGILLHRAIELIRACFFKAGLPSPQVSGKSK